MALYITATPIGNVEDITLRAKRLLLEATLVIGEERADTERFLKRLGRYPFPQIELLNEHSTESDVKELAALCANQDAILISDCGTPGFCDPGVELSRTCRAAGTRVIPIPGASSLMALLSVVGARFGEFHFAGFPPRDENARREWMGKYAATSCAVIAMDTPYRLEKFVAELAATSPKRWALLGMDLTLETERIEEGTLRELATRIASGTKAEFILCMYPDSAAKAATVTPSKINSVPPRKSHDQRPREQNSSRPSPNSPKRRT